MKLLKVSIVTAMLLMLAAAKAQAYPVLQLDIIGGYYNADTQTIVSSGPDFTLVALLTPKLDEPLSAYLNDIYYISAAVTPQTGSSAAGLGSFTWNDTNYRVTEDMTFGTPPLEDGLAGLDDGDLGDHDTFPTFFAEIGFQFSEQNRAVPYDSASNPGGLDPTGATSGVSYFATFNVTTSLIGGYELHFDLYNALLQKCRLQPTCAFDSDIAYFAPFTNDAESSKVSEPQSLAIMSMGLLLAGRMLRRRAKKA